MEFSLIWCMQIIFLIQISKTQYHSDSHDMDFDSEEMDYSHNVDYRRSKARHYHRRGDRNGGGRLPRYDDDYSDDCDCQCNQCDNPRPCCQQTCITCTQQQQPNVLFVPYPVPLIVTKVNATTTVRTTCIPVTDPPTTTEKPISLKTKRITSTEEPSAAEADNDYPDDNGLRSRSRYRGSRYMLTSLRKTKSNSLPKYGIVPIPDQLAESLMSQMRSMKGINSRNHRDSIMVK